MREPVPFRRPVQATFVESNGHVNGNGRPHVPDALLDEEDLPEDFYDDTDYEEDEQAEAESLREVASNEAPWSPTPVRPAREFIRQNDEAALNIVFPTVYDEDRSAKMKDLTTAQSVGAITHQRMSEQMAKELGFEQYDYNAELQQINLENKKLSPSIPTPADQALAAMQKAENPFGSGGGGSGSTMKVGAPTPGLAPEEKPEPVRRADLAGPATAEFRKQQKDTSAHLSEVSESVRELRQLITSGQQSESVAKLVGALDMAFARLEKSLATPPAPPVVNVEAPTPPQPVVNVEVPAPQRPLVVALESETPPRHVQVIRDERGLITEMREVESKPRPTPASPERLNEVIDSAFARFEERAGQSTDRAASRDHLIEAITTAMLQQFSQRRNVKVIRDERGLITEMRDEA